MSALDWAMYAGMTAIALMGVVFGKRYLRWSFFILLGALLAGMIDRQALSTWIIIVLGVVILIDVFDKVAFHIIGWLFDKKMPTKTPLNTEAGRQAWMRKHPYS